MKKKNSLIELYRFLFAMNVVKNHGFSLSEISYFSPGRVSVEFFFILSGFLFVRTLERLGDLPLRRGLPRLLATKLRPLAIPISIGLISNIGYNIATGDYLSGIWGYLWYVKSMMLTFVAYLVLRRLIKSDRAFFYVTLGIFAVATLMRFSGVFYSWGDVRALSAISLGMLVFRVPPLSPKRRRLAACLLVPVALSTLAIVAHHLANVDLFGGFRGVEAVLDLILYPALIYLTFQLPLHFGVFNYLGALSFGIYAFQCPADLCRALGLDDDLILVPMIFLLAILENALTRWRGKKKAQTGVPIL